MIVLLSPAKSLNFESPYPLTEETEPRFLERANSLAKSLRGVSSKRLQTLMDISPALGELNRERYAAWESDEYRRQARACLYAFDGDVYDGLQPYSLTGKAIERAFDRLRILSGLYGYLRPSDRILPYRLEMGVSWPPGRGALSKRWKKDVTSALCNDVVRTSSPFVVNLASLEYSQAVDFDAIEVPKVHPVFEDEKNGSYKIVSFLAKRARGAMARWLVEEDVSSIGELERFGRNGYELDRIEGERWYYRRSGF